MKPRLLEEADKLIQHELERVDASRRKLAEEMTEVEDGLLSCLLHDSGEVWKEVPELYKVEPEDFHWQRNRLIFQAMKEVKQKGGLTSYIPVKYHVCTSLDGDKLKITREHLRYLYKWDDEPYWAMAHVAYLVKLLLEKTSDRKRNVKGGVSVGKQF